MAEKNGNGQQGMDLIVRLHTEVLGLGAALDRQNEENQRHHVELRELLNRHVAEQQRLNDESKSHVRRMAEMILAIADKLSDHERRLAAVEAKVG